MKGSKHVTVTPWGECRWLRGFINSNLGILSGHECLGHTGYTDKNWREVHKITNKGQRRTILEILAVQASHMENFNTVEHAANL
jgi:hypothetical protein